MHYFSINLHIFLWKHLKALFETGDALEKVSPNLEPTLGLTGCEREIAALIAQGIVCNNVLLPLIIFINLVIIGSSFLNFGLAGD